MDWGINSWAFSPYGKYLVGGGWGPHDDGSPGNGLIRVWKLPE